MLTTPSNPGGLVWGRHEIARLIDMCKAVGSWVVVDQVYHEFLHDSAGGSSPECSIFNPLRDNIYGEFLSPSPRLFTDCNHLTSSPNLCIDSLPVIFCAFHRNMTCVLRYTLKTYVFRLSRLCTCLIYSQLL